MRLIAMTLCAAALLAPLRADEADRESERSGRAWRFDDGASWRGWLSDGRHLATAPARANRRDWAEVAALAAFTMGLTWADDGIRDWTRKKKGATSEGISDFAKPFGSGPLLIGLAGVHSLYGHFADETRARRTAWLAFESLTFTGVATPAFKLLFHRHRPERRGRSRSSRHWDGPSFDTDSDKLSFPSGHASTAFSVATVFALEYRDVPWVPPVAWGLAAAAALSRVHDEVHWASDVLAGSALGYAIARSLVQRNAPAGDDETVALVPLVSPDRAGFALAWRF